jgi:hypothetical protein
VARFEHGLFHSDDGSRKPTKQRVSNQGMTNIQFYNLWIGGHRMNIKKIQPMARVNLQTTGMSIVHSLVDLVEQAELFFTPSIRVVPGMNLDTGRTSLQRSVNLCLIRINEQ